MTTITREQAQAVSDLKAGYTLGHADVAILKDLARIALASLEAEAVGEVVLGEFDDCGCHPDARVVCIAADGQADWENFKDGTRLYTAPPAPVSVPDDVMAAMQKVARIRLDLNDFDGDKRGILDCLGDAEEALIEVVNRRAAMLQGAEPVTTAYKLPANTPCKDAPEHIWLQTAGVWPENGEFSELTWCSDNQHPDDTLYVRADVVAGNSPAHSGCRPAQNCIPPAQCGNSPVIPDGYVVVPVEPTMAMLDEFDSIIDYGAEDSKDAWSRLIASAPQQEAE